MSRSTEIRPRQLQAFLRKLGFSPKPGGGHVKFTRPGTTLIFPGHGRLSRNVLGNAARALGMSQPELMRALRKG